MNICPRCGQPIAPDDMVMRWNPVTESELAWHRRCAEEAELGQGGSS